MKAEPVGRRGKAARQRTGRRLVF